MLCEQLLADLTAEIEGTMKETLPVLSDFDLLNPECLDKSEQNRKGLSEILINHYSYVKSDSLEDRALSAVPVINPIHAFSELEDFMEAFDNRLEYLSDKLKKHVKQLVEEGILTEPENFVFGKKPTAVYVYKYMAADGFLKQFINIAILFKMDLQNTSSDIKC